MKRESACAILSSFISADSYEVKPIQKTRRLCTGIFKSLTALSTAIKDLVYKSRKREQPNEKT